MNYSTTLRVIGQKLEPLRPETYEPVCYSNSYLVRCRVKDDNESNKAKERQYVKRKNETSRYRIINDRLDSAREGDVNFSKAGLVSPIFYVVIAI
jgi:hypothetical protein